MKNGDNQAFPLEANYTSGPEEVYEFHPGLTKREYFAAKAMQGIMASHTEMSANGASSLYFAGMDDNIAMEAVSIADALLKALEEN